MIAGVGFGEVRESAALSVVEVAAIYDYATNRISVPSNELGHRVNDDVSPKFQRLYQVGSGNRVVYY